MATTVSPSESKPRSAYGTHGLSPWLNVDWREHQHWTIVNDTPVNVIELGEGPPLVFVHGLSGSWPNWLEQLPVFGASHRVIALDLPGFGQSPMPAEPITISGYARTLDALLEELGVSAAAVVGNSMGGFVSAELAINFPERVERLILVSAAGLSTYGDPRGLRALGRVRRVERLVAVYAGWVAAHSDTVAQRPGLRNAALGLVAAHPSRLPAPLAAELIRGAGKPGFVQGLAANLEYDFSDRLAEIVCPTLIVWGDRDRVITVRDAERFAELIPGARKVVFEDTGHVAMMERPAEFNALLAEFLRE
jgi:pimeloyl-ACP methyl ester carboxylesterase